jgi:transposase
MQVRRSRVTRNGRTYEYLQLVESYRREADGMPMHRVVANLGRADRLASENLEHAIAATRRGKRVFSAPSPPAERFPKPAANLSYLDLAVLLEDWRALELDKMMRALLSRGDADVDPADVVIALVLQRCSDPGSTLSASRWFPRTALPELLGVSRQNFNNTRLHRVLDDLDAATPELMRKLPRHYVSRDGAFASLFLDVSDACFVGQGPEIAQRGRAKTGLITQKIGIVLLCNEAGYPLRWETIPGAQHDSITMTAVITAIAGSDWLADTPVVMDRAMGKTANIRQMLGTGVRFLTALTVGEFEAYSTKIPHHVFEALEPRAADEHRKAEVERAAREAVASGMDKISDTLFVMDLGLVDRAPDANSSAVEVRDQSDLASTAMRYCREVTNAVADGRYASYAAAGRVHGLGKSLTLKYRELASLCEDIQREIIDGKAAPCALAELIAIARLKDAGQQHAAFAELLTSRKARGPSRRVARSSERGAGDPARDSSSALRVRAVAYFNPELFVDHRLRAETHKQEIATFVGELNEKLAKPGSKQSASAIAVAVDRKLRDRDLVGAYEVRVTEIEVAGKKHHRVEAKLKVAEWKRRRRYDGFSLLVAHPELKKSGSELCRLYRAKDAVEKDFQTIKSVVELEPIRHRTASKVRAHVTLCMLALLLERKLDHRLEGTRWTAASALETLSSCHVNEYSAGKERSAYVVTQTDREQQAILRKLGLERLADDEELASSFATR